MPEVGTERSVLANIERHVEMLNSELSMAHELGLKVFVFSQSSYLTADNAPRSVSVTVTRETELLQVPRPRPVV